MRSRPTYRFACVGSTALKDTAQRSRAFCLSLCLHLRLSSLARLLLHQPCPPWPPSPPPIHRLASTHVSPRPFLDSGRLFRQHLELLGPLQDYDLPADPDGSASEDAQNRARCHICTGSGRTRDTSAPGLPGPSYALFLPRCCALHFDGRTRQQQQRVHRRRRRRRPWLGACMRRRRRRRRRRRWGRLV